MSNINPPGTDRFLESFRALVQAELEPLKYAGHFQYKITGVNGSPPNVTLDCEPTDESLGMPKLAKIPAQPGSDGITAIPSAGMLCVVVFLNRDPSLPRFIGVDSLGLNPVARLGDQVTIFLPPTLPIAGTSTAPPGPFVGVITVANPITGTITQGSGKVFTG